MDSIQLNNFSHPSNPSPQTSDQAIMKPTAKWMMIIYLHLPFLLQVSLLHQRFQSKDFKYRDLLRFIRFILIPFNIFFSLQIMYDFTLYPLTRRGPYNLHFACWIVHLIMKSIEWGLISTFDGDPTFQLRTEFQSHHRTSKPDSLVHHHDHRHPQKPIAIDSKNSKLATPTSTTIDHSLKDILISSIHQITSFRGINYNWGWKARQRKRPTVSETVRLLILHNLIQTIGLVGCVLSRDHESPLEAVLSLGIPNFPGLWIIAEGLSTLCWGLLCTSGMEFAFCPLVLISISIDTIRSSPLFSTSLGYYLPDSFFDWWDPRLFVPLFNSPLRAKSLASLWSHHWHQIYRRSFIFLGILPATRFSAKLGLHPNLQRVLALFATFLVSGLLHELTLSFVAQSAHPAPHRFLSSFSGTLFYFLIQPVGIVIEPYVIRYIPSWLGGGSIWVLAFTLITARGFKNEYILRRRVIDDTYPPFKDWPLWAVLWPAGIMNF